MREAAAGYSDLIDRGSRTGARARLLHLLDDLALERSPALVARRVDAHQLAAEPLLRGAIEMHLDLLFRSSVSRREIAHTARHGLVFVSMHPALPDMPVAVVLAALSERLIERRSDLFSEAVGGVVVPFALAATPAGLGAGRHVLRALIADCARLPSPARVTTFSPLTGLRAHVIRCVDEPQAWAESLARHPGIDAATLQHQLLALLALECHPDAVGEPARGWLAREARGFAASERFAVGNFHRAMGAALVGAVERADPADSDALWWRAWFDYGRAAITSGGA